MNQTENKKKWEHSGFWLHYKRLEKGLFKWPSASNAKTLTIDERQLRWLLAGLTFKEKGATASAVIYSITETAKANELNPFYYLIYFFEQLPNIDTKDLEQLDELLPWSPNLPQICRKPQNKKQNKPNQHYFKCRGYFTLTIK